MEVGLISNVDIQWTNNDAYQWQAVDPDGSFFLTDARYLDAPKTVVVRGPNSPWTYLGHEFTPREAARNIVLKAAAPEHVHLTVSGANGESITNFGCEVFPYAQYDETGHEMTRQRSGEIDSKGAASVDLVLPRDEIALFCGAPGYARFYQVIDPRKVHDVRLVLSRAGGMKISTYDAAGKPRAGVHAGWQSDDAPLSYSGSAIGPDGTLFVQGLTPSTFDVSVDGYPTRRVTIAPDAITEVSFRPHPIGAALDQPVAPPPTPAPSIAPAPPPSPATASSVSSDAQVAAILRLSRDTYAALTSYSDSGTISTQAGSFSQDGTFTIRLQRPSLYRIAWTGTNGGGVAWSDGTGDYLRMLGLTDEKQKDRSSTLAGATGISSSAAATIPASFFNEHWGSVLSGVGECRLEPDDAVDNIPCHVVTSTLHPRDTTLTMKIWIGQEDHLIHKFVEATSGVPSLPAPDDAALKSILQRQNKPVTDQAIADLRVQLTNAQAAAKKMLSGGITFTQVHHNIQTNQPFVPADFRPSK